MTYPHPMDDHTGFAHPDSAECDCCGKLKLTVSRCWAMGIETFACATCRGAPEEDEWAEEF